MRQIRWWPPPDTDLMTYMAGRVFFDRDHAIMEWWHELPGYDPSDLGLSEDQVAFRDRQRADYLRCGLYTCALKAVELRWRKWTTEIHDLGWVRNPRTDKGAWTWHVRLLRMGDESANA